MKDFYQDMIEIQGRGFTLFALTFLVYMIKDYDLLYSLATFGYLILVICLLGVLMGVLEKFIGFIKIKYFTKEDSNDN